LLDDLDLYPQIFPGLSVTSNTATNIKDVSIQLALMLGNNDPDQVKSTLKGMRYTNDETDVIAFLMRFPEITKDSAPVMKKEFNRIKLDPSRLQEFAKSVNVRQRVIDTFLEFVSAPQAVNPRDLMDQGLKGGMHYINVLMAQLEDGHTYTEQFGPAGATRLAQVIRHELLHLNQFLQFSKGNPTEELYQEFMKEYGSAKGSVWQDEPYHTFDIGFSERETFAHQIADELVDELGLDGAMKILNQRTQVPHDLLQKNSDSYDMATEDLDDPNTESVKDMLSRARGYAIKIGKSR
jgi:hypothetical protein